MNFLEICGILWLVSVGAGGLWAGLCLSVDWWKSRRKRLRDRNRRWEQAIAVQRRRWQEYPKWEARDV